MGKKLKHLCDWKKSQIIDNLDSYRELVLEPRFVCKDCGRVANKKTLLCKPLALVESIET